MIQTVYVLQNSHTDIGFTHAQGRILRWQVDFIRQAIAIAKSRSDFAWTCETLLPVEHFVATAPQEMVEEFKSLMRRSQISVSGNYLNFNELPDEYVLEAAAARVTRLAQTHGIATRSAMTADINGMSLTYARSLARHGVRLLVTFVHPHHGHVPFDKRHHAFTWDLRDGQTLRVVQADHYHTGNELGFSPGNAVNYTAGFFGPISEDPDQLLAERLPTYLRRVAERGWPHDWLVIACGGLITDNSPPGVATADVIARWNQRPDESIRVKMVTLEALVDLLSDAELPRVTGDWPDWWADGVSGDPDGVVLFRQAQRDRRWLVAMSQSFPASAQPLDKLDDALLLFAEHTFGHSASVSTPWNPLAQQLRLRKLGYAGEAADQAEVLCDTVGDVMGGGALNSDRPNMWRVVNPHPHAITSLVELELEWPESAKSKLNGRPVRVVDVATNQVLPHQNMPSLRGQKHVVLLTLGARQQTDLRIEPDPAGEPTPVYPPMLVPERVRDLDWDDADVPPTGIRNQFVEIEWALGAGITRWFDVKSARPLYLPDAAASHQAAPFRLHASRLKCAMNGSAQISARRELGRNRNAADATWHASRLVRVSKPVARGPLLDGVELEYDLPGTEMVRLTLLAYRDLPRVDVELSLHKIGTWDVENVYLDLPFMLGDNATLWLDRGGVALCPARPDSQLPGSLLDYHAVQDGLGWCTDEFGVCVHQLDSHLIQTGPLDFRVRPRHGQLTPQQVNTRPARAWLMSNYWETNFSPELAGFYCFRYSVIWGKSLCTPEKSLAACRDVSHGLRAIRLAAR